MNGFDLIEKYFGGELSDFQKDKFRRMGSVYEEWNGKINVISRKDMDNFYLHHVLHSLSIAKIKRFSAEDTVMDIGCGGGFPGIPLAIMFPDTKFILVDSIGKKITVVKEVCMELGIDNVEAFHSRAEDIRTEVDYVVSRAVTQLDRFMPWAWPKIKAGEGRGVIYLKGGDLEDEVREGTAGIKGIQQVDIYDISKFFNEGFFETKKIIYIKKGKK